jgi:hypothetical protein
MPDRIRDKVMMMVPNGDLFQLVLGAEEILSLFRRFVIDIRGRCHNKHQGSVPQKSSGNGDSLDIQ